MLLLLEGVIEIIARLVFSKKDLGRHSVLNLTANMARNWFRDNNVTFLIVFLEIKDAAVIMNASQQAMLSRQRHYCRRLVAMVKRNCSFRRGGRKDDCKKNG